MGKPTIHYHLFSPPARFALMVARELNLDIDTKEVNLFAGEHKTEEYMKVNPTSTVPALLDGDFAVFDSHAIAIYLVEKYAKNDSLYPKDLVQRTKVNEVLFWDASFFFARMFQISYPIFLLGEKEISEVKIEGIIRGYNTLEKFLESTDYLVGNNLTLADLSSWPIVESCIQLIPMEAEKYPKIHAWLARLRKLPYYEELNKKGADDHVACIRACLARNNA